jgi:hypothetical protein
MIERPTGRAADGPLDNVALNSGALMTTTRYVYFFGSQFESPSSGSRAKVFRSATLMWLAAASPRDEHDSESWLYSITKMPSCPSVMIAREPIALKAMRCGQNPALKNLTTCRECASMTVSVSE